MDYSFLLKPTFNILQTMFFTDGLICSMRFFKDIITNVSYNNTIKNYTNLYILNIVERYSIYLSLYIMQLLLYEIDIEINKYIFIIITLPFIQNNIKHVTNFDNYLKHKKLFVKYTIANIFVKSLQDLHNDVINVVNYNIFAIFPYIKITFIKAFISNYLFISLMYFLKSRSTLYYYYKAIKVSYKYNTGYNFTQFKLHEAIFLVNLIIKEQRWADLTKIEVVNALYILLIHKYCKINGDIFTNSYIILYKFFSLWSLISFLKIIFHSHIAFKVLIPFTIYTASNKQFIQVLAIYHLFEYDANDITIVFFIVFNDYFYKFLNQVYFFIKYFKSISKVVDKISDTSSFELI